MGCRWGPVMTHLSTIGGNRRGFYLAQTRFDRTKKTNEPWLRTPGHLLERLSKLFISSLSLPFIHILHARVRNVPGGAQGLKIVREVAFELCSIPRRLGLYERNNCCPYLSHQPPPQSQSAPKHEANWSKPREMAQPLQVLSGRCVGEKSIAVQQQRGE